MMQYRTVHAYGAQLTVFMVKDLGATINELYAMKYNEIKVIYRNLTKYVDDSRRLIWIDFPPSIHVAILPGKNTKRTN